MSLLVAAGRCLVRRETSHESAESVESARLLPPAAAAYSAYTVRGYVDLDNSHQSHRAILGDFRLPGIRCGLWRNGLHLIVSIAFCRRNQSVRKMVLASRRSMTIARATGRSIELLERSPFLP